ncbi:MAG TPA: SpoIIE family protein phosphatase [Candidatus Baltobacteraceae bacterium]|nr:SpoIIE family protein phosphatase [Candidatus Baltobacteraceae bacterium]
MNPIAAEGESLLASALSDIRAFADALPQITWVTGADERLTFVNKAWLDYAGLEVGASFDERLTLVHPDDRERIVALLRDRLSEGEFRLRRAADGVYRWHLLRYEYVGSSESPTYRVGTAIDVHERRSLGDEQAFLSSASRHINASLDLEQTLRSVVQQAVPALADWCEIDLFGREGISTRAFAHRDAVLDERLQQIVGRVHDANPSEHYERVEAALRGGRTLLTRHVLSEMSEANVRDLRMLELYELAGVASSIVVPLNSRDRVLGWIVFMRIDAGNRYEEEHLALTQEFASRAALAIDNAQLFGREHRVADAMQTASLPRKLPKIPTIDMHAIYVPGQSEAQIGGDWYDAFRLRDGRLVISMGDVVGSGIEAAVTMSNMRQVIRGTAQLHADPVLMLDAADSALRLEDGDRYVTACVAVIDPVSRTMTYANAGHPPPYLRDRSSPPVALEFDDLPLGLRQRNARHARTTVLTPGAVLVFYTDGLIESTHDILDGIASLEHLIGSRGFYESANPAKFIRSHMLENGARDDVAILVVKMRSPSEHTTDSTKRIYCWTYDAIDPDVLSKVRERLQRVLEEHGVRSDAIERAKLVLGELVGNVARHAPGALQIVVDMTTAAPVLHVVDEGTGFEREPELPQDVLSEGGRGLFIVSELTQEFTISRGPGGGSHARAVLDA